MKRKNSFKNKFSSDPGFTLIELLVTVAILAVLIIMLLIAWRGQIDKANDAKRKTDLERLKVAFEGYYNDKECYPDSTILDNCRSNDLSPYLNSIPCDPVFDLPYCYISDGSECSQSFKLLAPLANLYDPIIEKLLCNSGLYCGYETECAQPDADYNSFNYGVTSSNIQLYNPDASPPPTSSPSPSPSSSPVMDGEFACSSGICNSYADPIGAGCPITFYTSDCDGECSNPDNWCVN